MSQVDKQSVFSVGAPCCMDGSMDLTACQCSPDERVLRGYGSGAVTVPMTPAQREWCVSEANWAGEGAWQRAELETLSDRELASTVISAWHDYARSQGML